MKKILLITSVLILLCVLLVSCNKLIDDESSKGAVQNEASLTDLSVPLDFSDYNVSITEDDETSKIDVSVPEENSVPEEPPSETSETEESQTEVVESYVWYGQEEMDQWFAEMKAGWESQKSPGEESLDGKHVRFFHQVDGRLINIITQEKFNHYISFAGRTEFGSTASSVCEYFGISKEEYMALYNEYMNNVGKAPYGEMPMGVYLSIDLFRYDAIFSEQFWNHPDYLLSSYVVPEIDDYYTSLKDRNGYMRVYYLIDSLLIEHVGVDAFEKWLEEKEDVDQNILDFVEHFGITREIYEDIYRETCYNQYTGNWSMLPYNTDYLFGTPEMQDEYFKVHPLN